MKAIILAAGRGSRMKHLTEEVPKCMMELHGKMLINWQTEALRKAGISEIAIVTGYKRELIADKADYEFHNKRWAETNMVSSLACADEWLGKHECIVSYSDIFYEPEAVKLLMASADDLAITYDPNWLKLWQDRFGDPLLDAETFKMDKDANVTEIGNKPEKVEDVQGQYMGLIKYTPAAWSTTCALRSKLQQEQQDKMHMTGTLQMIIESGMCRVRGVSYTGVWGEIDTEADLQLYNQGDI